MPKVMPKYQDLENQFVVLKKLQIDSLIKKNNKDKSLSDSMTEIVRAIALINYNFKNDQPFDHYLSYIGLFFSKLLNKPKNQLIIKNILNSYYRRRPLVDREIIPIT